MKLTEHSELHVVTTDGVSTMTLSELALAFTGGLPSEGIVIYSDPKDAQQHHERTLLIEKGLKALQSMNIVDLGTLVPRLQERAMDVVLNKVL
ncbi:MAG: hypothetical protein DRQ58_11555 [Gammaproteobacteria bacterium]|nr:MAG: hypothetical protein DRQ58_11555 [Gammaproteobacteria bacterium]